MNMHFIKHIAFVAAITVSALAATADIGAQIPASTLSKPASPEKAPNAEGFIQRWLLLEPIGASGLTDSAVQGAVKKEYFPDQFTVIPRDGDKVTVSGTELAWHAVDTVNYNVNLFHFARAQGKKTSDVLFWAVTVINCPHEMRDVRLSIGSNAASVWWVNGKEVIGIYGDRQSVIDDGVSQRLTLSKGPNVVRAAIVNGGGATDFCARFLDAEDRPLKEMTVNLSASYATPAPTKTQGQPQALHPDPNFYIFLCFGQSNMEGIGRIEEPDRTVDNRFQVLADFDDPDRGRMGGQWYRAVPPLTRRTRGISLVDSFGKTMVANLPKQIRIGVVKVSVSGTKIELWDKDSYQEYLATADAWKVKIADEYGGNPYAYMIELAKIAQQKGVIKGILLHQGESNAEDKDWPKKVKVVYDNLMKDLHLKPESVPLLAGEVVNADQGGEKASANEIIKRLPETLANSHVISSAGLPCNADHLHFTADGYRQFGKRYAAAMLSILGYKVNESRLPTPGALYAQTNGDWTEPFPPFRIAGNLYYVGSRGLANYLITTPQGHILINSDLEENVPLIRASVERLGFKFTDIKILLISHAHWDHNAASDTIKKLTGAKYMVMDADVPVVESGGKTDFQYGNEPTARYTPTKVDRVLHDGDEVKLGGTTLVAHLTPGHTKGCTTWTMKVQEAGKTYNVVVIGSPNVNPGYRLVNNTAYPQIAADYEKMFRVLKSLPCDIFLGAHGNYFDMEAKYARLKDGAPSVFVDPEGYKKYVADKEQAFKTELAKQRAALPR